MKKISLFLGIVLFSSVTVYSQQLTLNAESGNRAIEVANCWQFAGQTYTSAASASDRRIPLAKRSSPSIAFTIAQPYRLEKTGVS